MRRLTLIALAGLLAACTIDGPPPGRDDVVGRMERQDRIRQEVERRERLCRMLDPDSDRFERDCEEGRDPE